MEGRSKPNDSGKSEKALPIVSRKRTIFKDTIELIPPDEAKVQRRKSTFQGRRLLITGGLGFIGSNLARQCVHLGGEVTIYDCLDPRSGGNLYNIHDIKNSVQLAYHDIQDFHQLTQYVVNTDVIFNCAASTSHPVSMKEPWLDMDVNGRGVINLLEAIRRFNSDVKLVHIGTSTQLGKLHYQPADEKHPEFPTDIYSANKSVSEKYVLIYAKAYDIDAVSVRLSNVFGPRASIHSPEFTFNNYFIGLALQGKDVSVYGDGLQMRNVIYVDDAVSALLTASQADNVGGEIFFAVGDEHYNIAEIAKATVECIGSGTVRFVNWPKVRKSIDIGDAVISNQKIKRALDWSPGDNLKSGLMKTREYYLTCLEKYLR